MKNYIYFIFLFICCTYWVFPEQLMAEVIFEKRLDYLNFNGLGDYLPYTHYDKTIIVNKNKMSENIDILTTEEFGIIELAYNKNNQLLAYTYGTGYFSIPVIYDIKNKKKITLVEILKNGENEFIYEIIKDIFWIDEENILYTVYDEKNGMNHVKIYNIKSKKIKNIFTCLNITICDYNLKVNQMLYYENVGGKILFRVYDFNINSSYSVLSQNYSTGFIMNNGLILGIVTKGTNSKKSVMTVSQYDKILYEIKGIDDITGIYGYNQQADVLVLVTEEIRNVEFIKAVRLIEK